MTSDEGRAPAPRQVWAVGALCRAAADALDARFNPVTVRGELSSMTRAGSGHCYFTLKDAQGQLRCAMFRRSVQLLDFEPGDGELVDVRGRLSVYEARGDLQLVVESMERCGRGALFERFERLKAKLAAEGLFDAARKRPVPAYPRGIGLVTSLGAAALHDVVSALQRRVPHIPIVLAPAQVQGTAAAPSLIEALVALGARAGLEPSAGGVDVILLVRGGGSLEDLWSFNDEQLARAMVACPMPVISGVGHETDFTIADFCADLRAPTPTAAAELAALPRDVLAAAAQAHGRNLARAVRRRVDALHQRVDVAVSRWSRPSDLLGRGRARLDLMEQRLRHLLGDRVSRCDRQQADAGRRLTQLAHLRLRAGRERLDRAALRLGLLDPRLVLQRGYSWLLDAQGHTVSSVAQVEGGDALTGVLADGELSLRVATRAHG